MWLNRYKIYKTRNPELIITCVRSFPNLVYTIDKAKKYYKIDILKDNIELFNIYSLYNLIDGGVNFLPICFEDECIKLQNLKNVVNPGKGWFWCIGRMSPYLIQDTYIREIKLPDHITLKKMLIYSIDKVEDTITEFLFNLCVKKFIYENTDNFDSAQCQTRFKLIENTKLKTNSKHYLEFIHEMENRNIYEFMFNEFI